MASISHLGYWQDRRGKAPNAFPRRMLIAASALLIFSAGAIIFGQKTGIGTVKQNLGEPQAVRDIVLTRSADDFVVVIDAKTGAEIAAFAPNTGGFVRGSLRAFERMRLVSGVPADTPYRLIRWQAGMVSLSDTGSGERIYLEAFGKDNAGAFNALLEQHGGAGK